MSGADIPPKYADLGKKARDLFSDNYYYGLANLDITTKASEGKMVFNPTISTSFDTNKTDGAIETKYKGFENITLTEKWTTNNVLSANISMEDVVFNGLKLTFDASFAPNTGKFSPKVKSAYKRESFHATMDMDIDFAGPIFHDSFVFGRNGLMFGGRVSFDTAKKSVTKGGATIGVMADEYQLFANINESTEVSGSYYHKVASDKELGINVAWSSGNSMPRFGIASSWTVDDQTCVRAKLNNACHLGLSTTHTLREGMKLTLSSLIDTKNINYGGHKLGVGLDIEA